MGGKAKSRARRAGLRSKSSVAAVGGVRDTQARSAKQVTRRTHRHADGRVSSALAEAAKEREKLDKRIARESEHPALGPVAGAQYGPLNREEPQPEPVASVEVATFVIKLPQVSKLPVEGEFCSESVRHARTMVRQGYHAAAVVRRTGVGFKWIEDLVNANTGYLRGDAT